MSRRLERERIGFAVLRSAPLLLDIAVLEEKMKAGAFVNVGGPFNTCGINYLSD